MTPQLKALSSKNTVAQIIKKHFFFFQIIFLLEIDTTLESQDSSSTEKHGPSPFYNPAESKNLMKLKAAWVPNR